MRAAPILHPDIARLIPHQGSMCLLARVDAWDEQRIVCSADNHRSASHPLRTRSGLLGTCLVEYAAQAMALHGALCTPSAVTRAKPGSLAAARNVELALMDLDDLPVSTPDTLRIEAQREAGDARQLLYTFSAHHGGQRLAQGRLVVVLGESRGGE